MADDGPAPIIKKVKKVSGGGHHGGAWKVAYADFVTAMMAFFLLMWLLNATTEKQRKGLADFFSPTIPIHTTSGGGSAMFEGQSMMTQEVMNSSGRGAADASPTSEDEARGDTGFSADPTSEDASRQAEERDSSVASPVDSDFEMLAGMLSADSGESTIEDKYLQHIRTHITDEGLVIELFEREGLALFDPYSDTPTPLFTEMVASIARVVNKVTNQIAINGHTYLSGGAGDQSTDWLLSSNRAQTTRRNLVAEGLDPSRIARVVGKADREPAHDDIADIRNNRVEVILLR